MEPQSSLAEFLKGVSLIILGASIGLLTPIITSLVDKRKRKQTLKYDLIDALYIFFNWRKNQLTKFNQYLMFRRLKQIADHEYFDKNIKMEAKENLEELRNSYSQELRYLNSDLDKSFENILTSEARLLTIISESKDIFNLNKYHDLKRLIKPFIDASNISNEEKLHDYDSLDKTSAIKISKSLADELFKVTKDYQKQCDDLITEIEAII